MFETILVPLDGSDLAEQALEPAAELARKLESLLVLMQAVDSLAQRLSKPPMVMETPSSAPVTVEIMQEALDAEKGAAKAYLAGLEQRLLSTGVKVEAFVAEGPAADAILSVAQDQGAGMIVMSTHGRGGLLRVVFGSVADAILKRSHIPVLVIRSQEKSS
jgi:nucleotide-binding universal stress UspA family protein